MKFNDKILQLRDKQKMSQEELSEASGISVRTIQRIEKGVVTPRPYTIRKLLEALNVTLEELNSDFHNNSTLTSEENTKLNRFIMSNLLIFLLPVVFLIFLFTIWKKGSWSNTSNLICKTILSFQVVWVIITIVVILLTPFFINLFGGQNVVGQLYPTPVLVYLGISFVNILLVFQILKSIKKSSSKWTSIIPNLF